MISTLSAPVFYQLYLLVSSFLRLFAVSFIYLQNFPVSRIEEMLARQKPLNDYFFRMTIYSSCPMDGILQKISSYKAGKLGEKNLKGGMVMIRLKRALLTATAITSLYGLAWAYGSAFQDPPPAQSPAYGRGYGKEEGRNPAMGTYSSTMGKRGSDATGGSLGGPPSGGSMGGSSSGGR